MLHWVAGKHEIFVIFMTNHIHIESHPYKIILSKVTLPAKLCFLTLFDALVNVALIFNAIDLFVNIIGCCNLSTILLMKNMWNLLHIFSISYMESTHVGPYCRSPRSLIQYVLWLSKC